MLPLFTICDRWDVGGVSTAHHVDTDGAAVRLRRLGGAGIAELGWEAGTEHLAATLEAIDSCECTDGCPSCVQSRNVATATIRSTKRSDHIAEAGAGARFPSKFRDLNRQTRPGISLSRNRGSTGKREST